MTEQQKNYMMIIDDYQRKLCSGIYESPHGVIERKEFEEYSKEYSYRANCKLTGKFRSRKYFRPLSHSTLK